MKTKVAIIGSGFGLYGLLPSFRKVKGCEVVSICGKKSEKMHDCNKKLGINLYENWREMIQNEKPDAVAIAVIPKYQYEIAKYALENGIAVYAEKPLTTSVLTSLELLELAKKKAYQTWLISFFQRFLNGKLQKK